MSPGAWCTVLPVRTGRHHGQVLPGLKLSMHVRLRTGSQVPELLLTLRRTRRSLIEKNMSILLSTTLSMKLERGWAARKLGGTRRTCLTQGERGAESRLELLAEMNSASFSFLLIWVCVWRASGQDINSLQYPVMDFFLFHLGGRGTAFGLGQGGPWLRSRPGWAGVASAQLGADPGVKDSNSESL